MMRQRQLGRRGFSLVELLCAVAVTSVLILLAGQITLRLLDAWPRGRGQLHKNMSARLALEVLAQDLESAILTKPATSLDGERLQLVQDTAIGPDGFQIPEAAWLMFLAAPLDEATDTGDICAVSYRLGYGTPYAVFGGQEGFGLYRTVVAPAETFNAVQGVADLKADYWDAVPTRADSTLLSSNVVDFAITFRVRDTTGQVVEVTGAPGVRVGRELEIEPDTQGLSGKGRLVGAHLSVTIVSDVGAQRIREGTMDRQRILKEYGTTYSRYVNLTGDDR